MKISTKGRYGLRMLYDLATNPTERPRMTKDIAESQQISEKYISRLIIELRNAGLVKSVRGAHGGYHLNKSPAEITVLEVMEIMEGPIGIVECLEPEYTCAKESDCPTRNVWEQLNKEIRSSLSGVTLEDIIKRGNLRHGI